VEKQMTEEQIIEVSKQHFTELVAEGKESTDLYLAKSESIINFARHILTEYHK
jgi:hypothetical protein